MFGWRRKNDGFEWREYVRTTIKLRRDQRAQKIEEIKKAAAAGAIGAGRQSLSAGRSGIGMLWQRIFQFAHWLWATAIWAAQGVVAALGSAAGAIWNNARGLFSRPFSFSIFNLSARAKIALLFGILGFVAGLSAYLQYHQTGASWSAGLASLVSLSLLGLAVAPWASRWLISLVQYIRRGTQRMLPPPFGNAQPGSWHMRERVQGWWQNLRHGTGSVSNRVFGQLSVRLAGAIAAAVLVFGGALWAWQSGGLAATSSAFVSSLPSLPGLPSLPSLPSMSSLPSAILGSSLPDIKGSARAVSGDTLRIGRDIVRLNGIEAPEITQVCWDKRKRAWHCGQRAKSTLRRLVRRKSVTCSNVASADGGRFTATCTIGDKDIAAEMATKGYAFAQGTIFKTYSSAEEQARAARRGIWQGKVEKPSDFRAKRWELARKSAPDGCPIKGRIVRNAKVYVLPWALDYRQVRIRSKRGERWFCSESEATGAGFKPSSTG